MRRSELRRFIYFIFILCVIFLIIFILYKLSINEEDSKRLPVYYWQHADNQISCYSIITHDALQSVEDESFNPKTKSIFFHETSCRGGVDSRQACAVESAARANPDWEVYLLFNAPVSSVMLKMSCLVKLLQYPNVRLARIHADSFSRESAVQQIVRRDLRRSRYPVEHSADIMRMLTLYRWGGVYLDLDMLVAKSFDDLPQNWIAKYSHQYISSGAMRLSKDAIGQNLTRKILEEISETYFPYGWTVNGAYAIERVLLRRCESLIRGHQLGDCQGVHLLSHKQFRAENLSAYQFLTQPITENLSWFNLTEVLAKYYTYQVKSHQTSMYTVDPNSAYANLAAVVCPKVYHVYGDAFGI